MHANLQSGRNQAAPAAALFGDGSRLVQRLHGTTAGFTMMAVVGLLMLLAAAGEAAAFDAGAEDNRGIRWVYLERGPEVEDSLLLREMLRQAVLVTAREEFGLQTRDAVLDEPMPDNRDAGLVMHVTFSREANDVFLMYVFEDGRGEPLRELRTVLEPLGDSEADDLEALLVDVERWTRDELVEVFEGLGLEHRPREVRESAEPAEDVRRRLNSLSLFEQYVALRRTHQEIAEDGASPERLSSLSRAYGNLGELSRFHFNASEFVFYARSLLYAQRLMAQGEPTPHRHWTRAYAFAMAGLDYAAAAELAAAREGGADEPPLWVSLVDDLVHHRDAALERRGEGRGEEARTARYFRFLLAERRDLYVNRATTVEYGEWALELAPDSLRIIAGLTAQEGIGNLHRHARRGPEILEVRIPLVLDNLDELPDDVARLGRQIRRGQWPSRGIAELTRELVGLGDPADDPNEMSFALLGRLIEESHFYHVFIVGGFRKFGLGVEVADFVDAAMPSVEGHRYAPIIESLRLDHRRQIDRVNNLIGQITFEDVNLSHMALLTGARWSWEGRQELWSRMFDLSASNAHDLSRLLVRFRHGRPDWLRTQARQLRVVSPHSPIAAATLMELEWEAFQDDLPELKERFGDDTWFLSRLSEAYIDHGEREEARAVLERLTRISGDRAHYDRLASLHLEDGDEQAWRRTLERFLSEGNDAGLDRAGVAAEIANHYTATNRPEIAIPYAERAARSGSAWGMIALSRAHEAAGNFGESEEWRRRTAHRYSGSSIEWYLWCRRVGSGDRGAAAQLFRREMAEQDDAGGQLSSNDLHRRAIYYMLEGDNEEALSLWQQAYDREHDVWPALHMAVLAHRMERYNVRDRALRRVVETPPDHLASEYPDRPVLVELARTIAPAIFGESEEPLPLEALDERIEQLSDRRQVNVNYLYAGLLEAAGEEEAAETRLRWAARPHDAGMLNQVLAHVELRERGIDPRQQ